MVTRRQPAPLSPIARAFAAEIRAERTAKRMTQAELAKAAHLGLSTVGRIEKEEREADTTQLWNICRALGIGITEITERAERRMRDEARGDSRRASGG